jgi:threonine/homoserine/homoserine lactone efflux protein
VDDGRSRAGAILARRVVLLRPGGGTLGQAIGDFLPSAVGVAISPLPIVAVVLMRVTPRGRLNGPAFVAGWCVGLGIVGALVLTIAGGAGASGDSGPATWVDVLFLVLGVVLILVSARQWRGRPRHGEQPPTPRWMGALDTFTPFKAGGAGVVLSALNPKNLLLAVAGAAAIAQTGISNGQQAGAYVVFVAIASIGVAAPVVISFALGDRSRRILDGLKTWLARENAVIMAVLMLIIGVKLIGDAISGFSA